MICAAPAIEWPDVGNGEVPCCYGSGFDGPAGCTCWRPVYDLAQAEPRHDAPGLMAAPCSDCAYRAGSPERSDDPDAAADRGDLDRLAVTGRPFFCHDGMRRPSHYVHPTFLACYRPARLDLAYDPPIHDGVPYRADGRPGDLCAGWAAARLAHGRSQAARRPVAAS